MRTPVGKGRRDHDRRATALYLHQLVEAVERGDVSAFTLTWQEGGAVNANVVPQNLEDYVGTEEENRVENS